MKWKLKIKTYKWATKSKKPLSLNLTKKIQHDNNSVCSDVYNENSRKQRDLQSKNFNQINKLLELQTSVHLFNMY